MFAPTVNSYKRYQPESWAPTALAWGLDNRTCGFRLVGHGQVVPARVAHPRRRREPVPRVRGDDRGRAARHRARDRAAADASTGNAYDAPDVPHVPWNLVEAIDAFARERGRRDAFGADVHDHLLNTARQEWALFNRAVTDWELRRNFEQL